MKKMWSEDELLKFLKENPQITPEKLIEVLEAGDNITLELVEGKEGAKLRISASGGEITPQILFNLIKGSESVVVDLSEDEQYLEIHLDADILAKIDRALLLPLSVSEFKLIGVDNEANKKTRKNAPTQQLIGLDSDSLEVVNGKIKVKSALITHLYEHTIKISGTTSVFYPVKSSIVLITTNSETIDNVDKLYKLLATSSESVQLYVNGLLKKGSAPSEYENVIYINIMKGASEGLYDEQILIASSVGGWDTPEQFTINSVSDKVRQII